MALLFKYLKTGTNVVTIKFTKEGLKEFGPLFVCEALVKEGEAINSKSKLMCIEGMNMLQCLKSPFKEGVVNATLYLPSQCPSTINEDTPLLTITTRDTDALQSL